MNSSLHWQVAAPSSNAFLVNQRDFLIKIWTLCPREISHASKKYRLHKEEDGAQVEIFQGMRGNCDFTTEIRRDDLT